MKHQTFLSFVNVRIPTRKKEQDRRALQGDEPLYLTKEKIERLKRDLKQLKANRPEAIKEVQRTGEMGDFSENAEYQLAKRRLRSINHRITSIEERLKVAIEIERGSPDGVVTIGSTVTIQSRTLPESPTLRSYTIVGPAESNPMQGRISYKSPLGAKLMGKKTGDSINVNNINNTIINVV